MIARSLVLIRTRVPAELAYHYQRISKRNMATSASAAAPGAPPPAPAALPKLSASDFRVYNRMAESMDVFVSSSGSYAAK